jgi:hypothetical protein
VTVTDSQFTGNLVSVNTGDGGAICTTDTNVGPVLSIGSSDFTDNSAPDDGGAIYAGGPTRIRNAAFWSNDTGGDGGAIRASTRTSSPQILSSSFYENSAVGLGGGVALVLGTAGTSGIVRNTAMWANSTDMDGENLATITYTCSEEFLSIGTGNELALNDPFVLGVDGELFLDQTSICVDNGNDVSATTDYAALGLDWQDLTTAADSTLDETPVDMGAHYLP